MATSETSSEPVVTVQSISLLGAKVRHKTGADGETSVFVMEVDPSDSFDARMASDKGEL